MLRLLSLAAALAVLPPLVAGTHGDFSTFTYALTWQPGICSVDDPPPTGAKEPETCAAGQPHTPLIGLHGLWPSMPQSLIADKTPIGTWFGKGCDLLHHGDAAPAISADLRAQLDAVMPHYKDDLLTHEYVKHVQCFDYDATAFFQEELAMRRIVEGSAFGGFLLAHAGRTVAHDDVVAAFKASFATTAAKALQLECSKDPAGRVVLTQFWMTISAPRLSSFPAATSFVDTPADAYSDTCPATFLMPTWRLNDQPNAR